MEAWLNEELNRQPSKLCLQTKVGRGTSHQGVRIHVEHQELQVKLACTVCVQILRSSDLMSRIPYTHVINMTYGTQYKRKCNN